MMNHTPGPWQVSGSHIYTADPERAMLAQVFNPGSKASDFPLGANARLMATAPELLAAVKLLLTELVFTDTAGTEAAHAAILKATGEQS